MTDEDHENPVEPDPAPSSRAIDKPFTPSQQSTAGRSGKSIWAIVVLAIVVPAGLWWYNGYRIERKPVLRVGSWEQVASDPKDFKGRRMELTLTAAGSDILLGLGSEQMMVVGKAALDPDKVYQGSKINTSGKWVVLLRVGRFGDYLDLPVGQVVRVRGKVVSTMELTTVSQGYGPTSSDTDDYPVVSATSIKTLKESPLGIEK